MLDHSSMMFPETAHFSGRVVHMKSPYYVPELIEDGDILFNKNSDYLKQKKQEKKNPIFKRRTAKRR